MESLVLTPKIRELIANRAQEYQINEAAMKEGMVTLRENGLKKVLAGATTWEEVVRLTVGDQDAEVG